jgi:hypothetical protein
VKVGIGLKWFRTWFSDKLLGMNLQVPLKMQSPEITSLFLFEGMNHVGILLVRTCQIRLFNLQYHESDMFRQTGGILLPSENNLFYFCYINKVWTKFIKHFFPEKSQPFAVCCIQYYRIFSKLLMELIKISLF